MTTALQQQVFALDARYNANRAPGSPNFRTLYIRRRSQLLRETSRSPDQWKQYLRYRSLLLQQRYSGSRMESVAGSTSNLSRTVSGTSLLTDSLAPPSRDSVVPTKEAEASRAIVGDNTISENYAFSGVHHVFDQHSNAVTMVKFANNDRSRICCSSLDATLSICDVTSEPPRVLAMLRGHEDAVSCFDWSANNDLIVSVSVDATVRLWNANGDRSCLRVLTDPKKAQILSCLFQPVNNNMILVGNKRGDVRIVNVSTGLFSKHHCKVDGGVLCLTSDTNGRIVWTGSDVGEITSILCQPSGGLIKLRKLVVDPHCYITCLCYRTWISREARDPLLLVNASNNSICLYSVIDDQGGLTLKKYFQNRHLAQIVRSTFCPIMSFRQGACVVTGSEDGNVYFIDVEKTGGKSVINTLQGHARTVLSISFNYDESLLASSDLDGLVIIWKRDQKTGTN